VQLYIVYFGKRAHRSYAREHTLTYIVLLLLLLLLLLLFLLLLLLLYTGGVRSKSRRAHAAAAGPGLWKLCEQSRRQVRGLIDFRHPLSSPQPALPRPRAGHIAPKQNASRPTNRRVHRFRKIRPGGGVRPRVGVMWEGC